MMGQTKILLLIMFIQASSCTDPLEIQPIKSDSGIYYEEIGRAGLYSNEWVIVSYFDLKNLRSEYETMIKLTQDIRKICKDLKPFETICNGTITHLNYLENQIAEKNNLILPQKRFSRALVSLIGKIGKPLFGILNEDDAREYDRKIEKLTSNQETLLNIVKNQTILVDLTVNVFNKTREEIGKDFTVLSRKINELRALTDSFVHKTDVLDAAIQFESIVSLIVLIMMRYHTLQAELLNLLINSQHGNFQSSLFTPSQIENLFMIIRKELPNSYKLPFNSIDNLPLQLHKMSSTSATVLNDKIIMEIKFPLPLKETYQLYRVYPFPTQINNSLCYIQPSSEFFLIDINREHYYHLSSDDLQHCIKKDDTQYYCRMTSPLYNANLALTSCEASLIRLETIKDQCQTRCSGRSYYLIPLNHPNTWLYTTRMPLQIDVVCKEAIKSYSLESSGLVKLKPGCYVRSKFFILHGQNYELSEIKNRFSPIWNLTNIIENKQVNPIHKNISETTQRLNKHNKEIEELRKSIKFQKEQENKISLKLTPHHLHHYTMTYVLVVIIIALGILYFCKKRLIKIKREPSAQPIQLQIPNPRLAFYEVDPPPQGYAAEEQIAQI